jgi:hypothetical protein
MRNQYFLKAIHIKELMTLTKEFLLQKSENWQKNLAKKFIGMNRFVKK